MSARDRKAVSLLRLMGERDVGQKAAMCMLAHGQVKLDGRVLGTNETRLPEEELYGKLLEIPGRSFRLLGSRAATSESLTTQVDEQLTLL